MRYAGLSLALGPKRRHTSTGYSPKQLTLDAFVTAVLLETLLKMMPVRYSRDCCGDDDRLAYMGRGASDAASRRSPRSLAMPCQSGQAAACVGELRTDTSYLRGEQ